MMVARRAPESMLGLKDGVSNKLPGVLILQAIKHAGAFMTRRNHPGHPHLGQMLRHGRLRLTHRLGKIINRHLAITQSQDYPNPRSVGKHREDLHRQLHIPAVHVQPAGPICIHANIITYPVSTYAPYLRRYVEAKLTTTGASRYPLSSK